jgi:hypothetical protein
MRIAHLYYIYFVYVRPKKSNLVGLGVELISLEGAERIDSNHGGGVGLPAGGQLNGGGGGGCPQAAEWELPSEAFEQRQEILEGGRTEDQLLVDDAATDQASSVLRHFVRSLVSFFGLEFGFSSALQIWVA